MKKFSCLFVSFVLTALALILGGGANVIMATAAVGENDGGGTNESGAEGGNSESASNEVVGEPDGIATETMGRANGDPDFYLNDVDKRIVKIRPFSTPIDQISRYAKTEKVDSFVCKYYSSGTRPIKTVITADVEKMTSGKSTKLSVKDPAMFTLDDTIIVPSVKAKTNFKGGAYKADEAPFLELCVCGRDTNDNMPIVYAVNGDIDTESNEPIWIPEKLTIGTEIIRMGKSGGELDVQTGRFTTRPTAETNFCQNFMIQIEQSTFDKIAAKEVNWDFSDIEEDGIYDMRLAQEFSFLFGDMMQIHHVTKDGMTQWFTRGIWYQVGKHLKVGAQGVISPEDLVDLSKDIFDGVDAGNRRVLLASSDLMAALDKIQVKDSIVKRDFFSKWHLDFTELSTTFGKLDIIHCQVLNQLGDDFKRKGIFIDPDLLSKKVHVTWARNILDLKKAGVRNTDAVVIQEVAALCLRNKMAHGIIELQMT